MSSIYETVIISRQSSAIFVTYIFTATVRETLIKECTLCKAFALMKDFYSIFAVSYPYLYIQLHLGVYDVSRYNAGNYICDAVVNMRQRD